MVGFVGHFSILWPESAACETVPSIQSHRMLSRLYVEALLVDTELADKVWELWNAGVITDELAALAWRVLLLCAYG